MAVGVFVVAVDGQRRSVRSCGRHVCGRTDVIITVMESGERVDGNGGVDGV